MKFLENFFLLFQKAKFLGQDYYGNSYFLLKSKDYLGRPRRYVKYFSKKQASAIPPLYSAWLTHGISSFDEIMKLEKLEESKKFTKPHQPNLTGTNLAYDPSLNVFQKSKNTQNKKIYESWTNS
jgi:NADH:ubiquinone oxidoreductase subunit